MFAKYMVFIHTLNVKTLNLNAFYISRLQILFHTQYQDVFAVSVYLSQCHKLM